MKLLQQKSVSNTIITLKPSWVNIQFQVTRVNIVISITLPCSSYMWMGINGHSYYTTISTLPIFSKRHIFTNRYFYPFGNTVCLKNTVSTRLKHQILILMKLIPRARSLKFFYRRVSQLWFPVSQPFSKIGFPTEKLLSNRFVIIEYARFVKLFR